MQPIAEDEKKTFSFSDRDRCCYVQGAERPGCACQDRNQALGGTVTEARATL